MRTLKDDQFDRRKVEVRQRMEPKRTNSPIDFLRPEYMYHSVKSWQKPAFDRASGTERRSELRYAKSSIFIQLLCVPRSESPLCTQIHVFWKEVHWLVIGASKPPPVYLKISNHVQYIMDDMKLNQPYITYGILPKYMDIEYCFSRSNAQVSMNNVQWIYKCIKCSNHWAMTIEHWAFKRENRVWCPWREGNTCSHAEHSS